MVAFLLHLLLLTGVYRHVCIYIYILAKPWVVCVLLHVQMFVHVHVCRSCIGVWTREICHNRTSTRHPILHGWTSSVLLLYVLVLFDFGGYDKYFWVSRLLFLSMSLVVYTCIPCSRQHLSSSRFFIPGRWLGRVR